jgi:hypothetical protein
LRVTLGIFAGGPARGGAVRDAAFSAGNGDVATDRTPFDVRLPARDVRIDIGSTRDVGRTRPFRRCARRIAGRRRRVFSADRRGEFAGEFLGLRDGLPNRAWELARMIEEPSSRLLRLVDERRWDGAIRSTHRDILPKRPSGIVLTVTLKALRLAGVRTAARDCFVAFATFNI